MSVSLDGWTAPGFVPPDAMRGRVARLQRLSEADHAEALHAANAADPEMWRWMGYGPFASMGAYRDWVGGAAASEDPVFYAIRGAGDWADVATYMRIDTANGVIEIGNIALAAALQRTVASTEAIHVMIDRAFAMGFRRVEWKCDAGNARSMAAARRYGFAYEGTFRQHMVIRGANRDTAWFAILDGDWPRLRAGHRTWLAAGNFDAAGRQVRSLSECLSAGR